MSKIINWLKNHKLTAILIIIVLYFLYTSSSNKYYISQTLRSKAPNYSKTATSPAGSLSDSSLSEAESYYPPPINSAPPTTDITNRLVIKNSYLSLLVDNVTNIQKQIINKAQELGGYMVNSNLSNPQDAPTATLTLRIPSDKLTTALDYLRSLAVKVISENLEGEDVTDEYVDIGARMTTYLKTKVKFEEIMDKAVQVQDILTVQRELINLQAQIDSLKGQQDYLQKNAQMAKITIYLSTDELALPYSPSETWRPKVIFKQAARSLISTLRKIGSLLIWLFVYSIIWLPIILIIFFLRRRKRHNPPT